MTNSIRRTIAAAAVLATTAGSVAFAQDQGGHSASMMGPGMMGRGMGPGMMGWGMRGMMGPGMQEMMGPGMMMGNGPMMEGRLAYLKAELGISEAQTEAWNGYVNAVKARASTMQSTYAAMMQTMQSGSAVERLQAHIRAMESMVETLKALSPATEALYKVLSDEQKKKADLLLGAGCCMM